MSSITDIKRKILELAAGQFQELCDTLLAKHGYGTLHGLGMQAGTGNTTKGNPDSYFRQANGKYVFVAYTTQQKSLFSKLKEDIDKCLDSSKTGLAVKEIEEIIYCHRSSNLRAGDDKALHNLCEAQGVALTIWGIDELANQIHNHYRSLAKDYLGLPLDTNQILSVEEFVTQYDANAMLAPLNTAFLYRANEKAAIMSAVREAPIVIVAGKAGVGKTRLVLEAVREISATERYRLLCVKNNNLGLYDDLVSATEQPGNYLFFIDDANELAEIDQILAYTTKGYLGYTVKIIATVRDYVKEKVLKAVEKYAIPRIVEVNPFTDKEIEGFLGSILEIRNTAYLNQILRIAEGNPRNAYMAGKLAIQKQSLTAINDVSQLYDVYYEKYVNETIGDDEKLCFAAGVLAIVNAGLLDNLSALQELLDNYGITTEDFRKEIRQLSKLEVAEIYLDRVATLSDQCFANYILYSVFFEKKLIPFSVILEIGYKHFRTGVIRAFNTIASLFDSDDTRTYYTQEIRKAWDKLKTSGDSCYNDFARDFHVFNPEEAFLLARQLIKNLPSKGFDAASVDFSEQRFCDSKTILAYLDGYQYSEYLECVIEILLEYCSKTAETLVSGYTWLKNAYGITRSMRQYDYATQSILSDCLYKMILAGNIIAKAIGFHWAEYLLGFSFHYSEMGRKNCVTLYTMKIDQSEGSSRYRNCCWKILNELASDPAWHEDLLRFLYSYANALSEKPDHDIVSCEVKHVEHLLSALKCDCVYYLKSIQMLLINGKRMNVDYDKKWDALLTGFKWDLYQLLDEDFRSSGLKYEVYQKKREALLSEYGRNILASDIPNLVHTMNAIMSAPFMKQKAYAFNQKFGLIIQQFNTTRMQTFMQAFILYGGSISIPPRLILEPLNKSMDSTQLLSSIKRADFPQKNEWLFSFFDTLPPEKATSETLQELLLFLGNDSDKSILSSSYRSLRVLDKFLNIEPNIYPIACSIILEKRKYSPFMARVYLELLFHDFNYTPQALLSLFQNDLDLLQEIYFYILENVIASDFNGTFLTTFLSLGDSWLQKYAELLRRQVKNNRNFNHYRCQNSALWKSKDHKRYFDSIFSYFSEKEDCNYWTVTVFRGLLTQTATDDTIKQHQQEWLNHIITDNLSSDDKLVVIFEFLCELDEDLRRNAIKRFLEHNRDPETFGKLMLVPNHWSGTNSLIPAYQKQIDFLESLYSLVPGLQFLKHKAKIKAKVDALYEMIKREEVEEICTNLYL